MKHPRYYYNDIEIGRNCRECGNPAMPILSNGGTEYEGEPKDYVPIGWASVCKDCFCKALKWNPNPFAALIKDKK